MTDAFMKLKTVIDYIQQRYERLSIEWEKQNQYPIINLKKSEVRSIDFNSIFYQSVLEYISFLSNECSTLSFELCDLSGLRITSRIKTQNSIEYKVNAYRFSAHENGKVPIVKCLNDLFGLRVVFDPDIPHNTIYDFVKETYGDKYRCIDSSKGDYKAIHVYFKLSNKTFPWELQIWNKSDEKTNLESHKKYKQGYTAWESNNKQEGGSLI